MRMGGCTEWLFQSERWPRGDHCLIKEQRSLWSALSPSVKLSLVSLLGNLTGLLWLFCAKVATDNLPFSASMSMGCIGYP